jgi:GGDEF domain-containing protein
VQFHSDVVDAALKVLKDIKIDDKIHQLPITELEEERFAYFFKDSLTNIYSKNYLELILNKNLEEKLYHYISAVFIENFSQYNEKFNWKAGDNFLCNVADSLKLMYPNSLVFRIYGDDFLLLSKSPLELNVKTLEALQGVKESEIIFNVKMYNLDQNNINNFHDLEVLLLKSSML